MYLQVTTLSEITNHTGTELLSQILMTKPSECPKGLLNISYSTLQWPLVNCPSLACWRLWTSTIRTLYTSDPKGTKLTQPLGGWLCTHDQYRFWHWRMADNDHLVYRHHPSAPIRVAIPTMRHRTMVKFSPTVPTLLAFKGPPITPLDPTTGQVHLPIPAIAEPPPPPPLIPFFSTLQQQFRSTLLPWQTIMYGSLKKAYSYTTLHKAIVAKCHIIIVSDASVQHTGQSGFAWVIATHTTPLWRGMGLAPGPAEVMHSGRAEAFGMLAAVNFLQFYIQCFQPTIPPTKIDCYCDNLGVIQTLCSLNSNFVKRPNDTTNDDYDIHLAIHTAAQQCPALRLQYWHVKGHQDDNPDHKLTVEEQHNVDCDKMAKKFVSKHPQRSTAWANPEFPEAAPHLKIDGKLICRKVLLNLRQAAVAPPYWEYLRKRYIWTHSDMLSIQWDSFKTALTSFPWNDQ